MEVYLQQSQNYLKEFNDKIEKKNSYASEAFRKSGNALYQEKGHTKAIHREILALYSESIAYAPNNSNELAYAYANRSALLFHLNKYNMSITDIERALKISNHSKFKKKLEIRKADCLRMLNETNHELCYKPSKLPEIISSRELPSVSNSIELRYNEQFGRHLVANRDIKTGEILIIEKGYAHCPRRQQLYIICSHCLKYTWTSLPCEQCVYTMYCSNTCKQEAYNNYHDIECKMLPFIFCNEYLGKSVSVLLTVRLLICAFKEKDTKHGIQYLLSEYKNIMNCIDERTKGFSNDGKFYSNKFRACCSLITHMDKLGINAHEYDIFSERILFLFTPIFQGQLQNKSIEEIQKTYNSLKELIVRLQRVATLNTFEYTGYECSCENESNNEEHQSNCIIYRGSMLIPCTSLINHSCHFNVEKICENGRIILFSLRLIKKGEQLFYCYGPGSRTGKLEKQNYLQEKYFFTCNCKACQENWIIPTVQNDQQAIKSFEKWTNNNSNLKNQIDYSSGDSQSLKNYIIALGKQIDSLYVNGVTLETEISSLPFKSQLLQLYSSMYNTEFDIPESC